MINSFGTGEPDGCGRESGRGKRTEAAAAAAAAKSTVAEGVRLVGFEDSSSEGSPPHGQRRAEAKPPTAAGDSRAKF